MIGQHPDLYGFPELKLFAYPTIGELAASLPAEARRRGIAHRSPGLVRSVAELQFGGQSAQALAAAAAWLAERQHWTGPEVLDRLMEHVRPRHAVEKSPEHVAEAEPLRRLADAYPDARFIHLSRHPVATVNSMHTHLRKHLPGYDDNRLVQDCISTWLETHTRIVEFARRLPGDRILRVKAEDLLNDPGPQLDRVARWLGIRTDETAIDAMRHPERSPYASFAPSSSGVIGGNDPNFLADPRPRNVEVGSITELPSWWPIASAQRKAVERAGEALGYT